MPKGAASSATDALVLSPWGRWGVRGPQALSTPSLGPRRPAIPAAENQGSSSQSRSLCPCPTSHQLGAAGPGVQRMREQCGAFSLLLGAHQPPVGGGGLSDEDAARLVAGDRTDEGQGQAEQRPIKTLVEQLYLSSTPPTPFRRVGVTFLGTTSHTIDSRKYTGHGVKNLGFRKPSFAV